MTEPSPQSYFGCFSGDCPHAKQSECDEAIRQHCAELEARIAVADGEAERLRDLVRYCRAELAEANLITDKEYAELAALGKPAVARLEGYDSMRRDLAAKEARIAELEGEVRDYRNAMRNQRLLSMCTAEEAEAVREMLEANESPSQPGSERSEACQPH